MNCNMISFQMMVAGSIAIYLIPLIRNQKTASARGSQNTKTGILHSNVRSSPVAFLQIVDMGHGFARHEKETQWERSGLPHTHTLPRTSTGNLQ